MPGGSIGSTILPETIARTALAWWTLSALPTPGERFWIGRAP